MDRRIKWDKANVRENLRSLYYVDGRTLQEIGEIYGVTRERVRQVMEMEHLPRHQGYYSHKHPNAPRYKTLKEYFSVSRKCENPNVLNGLHPKIECQICNGTRNLHFHHKRYPATCIEDFEILCASCHHIKHLGGITHTQRSEIYSKYRGGIPTVNLAKEYGIARITIYKIINAVRDNNHTLHPQ